jgi:hypothetical protein
MSAGQGVQLALPTLSGSPAHEIRGLQADIGRLTDSSVSGQGLRRSCRPPVELSNVFVRNAFPWLVVELPNDAHGSLFVNGKVWQAIRCGAKDGALRDCVR